MSTETIIVVAILAIVAVAALAYWATRQRQTRRLRERFGPEYERAVESAANRQTAEADLRARQERVDALEIRPLETAARDRFAERWREVQAMFVDDPGNAVDQADKLIGEVMRARGYPVGDFEQRAADVSVNHPQVVDHYRTAHTIAVKRRSGEGATEQLRQAFVHYRALFADLLEVADTAGDDRPATEEARRAPGAEATPSAAEGAEGQQSRIATRPRRAPISDGPAPETGTPVETQEPADTARRTR